MIAWLSIKYNERNRNVNLGKVCAQMYTMKSRANEPTFSKNERKCAATLLDLEMAVDPAPPRGNFDHYDFLILQCLSYKMRHVSPLRSVALSCNIKITYVTPKIVKKRLVSML